MRPKAMKSDIETLKAWCHWKREEQGLSDGDRGLVTAIEDVISQVGTWKAKALASDKRAHALADELDTAALGNRIGAILLEKRAVYEKADNLAEQVAALELVVNGYEFVRQLGPANSAMLCAALNQTKERVNSLERIVRLILKEWDAPTEGILRGELIARLSQYAQEARKALADGDELCTPERSTKQEG